MNSSGELFGACDVAVLVSPFRQLIIILKYKNRKEMNKVYNYTAEKKIMYFYDCFT